MQKTCFRVVLIRDIWELQLQLARFDFIAKNTFNKEKSCHGWASCHNSFFLWTFVRSSCRGRHLLWLLQDDAGVEVRASLRVQSEVQGREIHHWAGSHDQGERMGEWKLIPVVRKMKPTKRRHLTRQKYNYRVAITVILNKCESGKFCNAENSENFLPAEFASVW